MEEFRLLGDDELEKAYNEVFREAFPPEELKPLEVIRSMRDTGHYQTFTLCVDGELSAFIFNWQDGRYVLIDYLCVRAGLRNGGLGGRILAHALKAYPKDTVFVGEVEAPEGGAEDALRLRRLGFYERSGASYAGYDSAVFGVHYKTIYWAEDTVPDGEIMAFHDSFYKDRLSEKLYARAVQIPLKDGEPPRDRTPWTEPVIKRK